MIIMMCWHKAPKDQCHARRGKVRIKKVIPQIQTTLNWGQKPRATIVMRVEEKIISKQIALLKQLNLASTTKAPSDRCRAPRKIDLKKCQS